MVYASEIEFLYMRCFILLYMRNYIQPRFRPEAKKTHFQTEIHKYGQCEIFFCADTK